MISVCMATYNGIPYIKKQVNSILSQLGEDDELIVSDDGSVDNTRKMLLSLQDSRVKLFSNSPNNGVVSNFENALLHAAGDIIFLSDQDDIWRNDKAIMISEKLLTNIMVVSDCAIINENDDILYESYFKRRKSRSGIIKNLYKNSYLGCCIAFRRELLTYALPFPTGIHMHDWWLGLIAEMIGTVHFLPEPLVFYRQHQNNYSETLIGSKNTINERIKRRISVILPMIIRARKIITAH